MKRLAEINAVPYGSTGHIVKGIREAALKDGWDVLTYYSYTHVRPRKSKKENILVGSFAGKAFHMIASRLTGQNGCFSLIDTLVLVHRLKRFHPDVIHLHILHSWYINLPILFRYIKKYAVPVVWTMHDCWAFTGQCPHFVLSDCDKWKTGCNRCPQYRQYPEALVDRTKTMWKKKKKWFGGVRDLTVVTPSEWLARFLPDSFLSEYECRVIRNGIDTDVFRPVKSDIRSRYGIGENQTLLLSVAYDWSYAKGLDVLKELSRRLDPALYRIVLVGADAKTEDELKNTPVLPIRRTQNREELAALYSAADLFINATRQDTFPTVNMEAAACGTPVLTFDTGGCRETVSGEMSRTVPTGDVESLIRHIESDWYRSAPASACPAESLDQRERFGQYLALFDGIIERNRRE